MTATETPPTTKGELTRRSILDAAIERFGREGYRATSVADIARDAGISGTATYAYFPNKEALFLAAADQDSSAVIREGVTSLADPEHPDDVGPRNDSSWRQTLIVTLVAAIEHHPLARRLLAGLEPDVTARVIEVPALNDLRRACADQLRREQVAGLVRADIDPVLVANGIVSIMLSLLMSIVQLGPDATAPYTESISSVFEAALNPLP